MMAGFSTAKKTEESENSKPIDDWGTIHCAECDGTIAYFPPEIRLNLHDDLPLYCGVCAEHLSIEGN